MSDRRSTLTASRVVADPLQMPTFESFAKKWKPKVAEAQAKLVKDLGFGSGGSFGYDQTTRRFTLTKAGETDPFVIATASILGSYSNGSWMWAWANPSILEDVAKASTKVKKRGEKEGWSELTTDESFVEPEVVEEMLAAAFGVLSPLGLYFVPTRTGKTALVIESAETVPKLPPTPKKPTPKKPKVEPARAAKAKAAPCTVSVIVTTTSDTKSRVLSNKNVTAIEQHLTAAIAKKDFGTELTVRLSIGLFPFDSPWGKMAEKKKTAPAFVKSSRFLVVERNMDDTALRKLDKKAQQTHLVERLTSAVDDLAIAKRLPAELKVAELQAALRRALEKLPTVLG